MPSVCLGQDISIFLPCGSKCERTMPIWLHRQPVSPGPWAPICFHSFHIGNTFLWAFVSTWHMRFCFVPESPIVFRL
jgi:hypothetical protein